jgi:hypothetical protein
MGTNCRFSLKMANLQACKGMLMDWCMVWQKGTNVSKEPTVSVFRVKE